MKKQQIYAFSLIELSVVILIIGILIAGVTSSSRLVKAYKVSTARTLTKSARVASVPDLVLWLDATAEEKITNTSNSLDIADGDRVKTWIDQNPQTSSYLTFTETSSGIGPQYLTNGINNLPTLFFNGSAPNPATSGNGLKLAYTSTINTTSFTLFIVSYPIAQNSVSTYPTLIMNRVNSATYGGYNLYKLSPSGSTSSFEFNTGTNSTDGWLSSNDSSITLGQAYVTTLKRTGDSATDQSIIYRNGTQKDADAATTSPYFTPNPGGNSPNDAYYIGCYNAASGFFNGYISEVIIFARSLSNEERTAIESYLLKKYGIKA